MKPIGRIRASCPHCGAMFDTPIWEGKPPYCGCPECGRRYEKEGNQWLSQRAPKKALRVISYPANDGSGVTEWWKKKTRR